MLATCRTARRLSLSRRLTTEAAQSRPTKTQISTAVVLTRSPFLTRSPTDFEQACYSYQQRVRRAIANPFPNDFYFKPGSLLETRFNMEERRREALAFGEDFLPEETASEEERAANEAAVEQLAQQEGEGEELVSRVHSSDQTNDVKSLDRQGERNLYLLIQVTQEGKDVWRFPEGPLAKGSFLHQSAQQSLFAECGDHMDTWIVGRAPIGYYKPSEAPGSPDSLSADRVVFLYKAHIMAGQVKPEGKDVKDFAWLTKQEIEKRVPPHYWQSVKDVLSDF